MNGAELIGGDFRRREVSGDEWSLVEMIEEDMEEQK